MKTNPTQCFTKKNEFGFALFGEAIDAHHASEMMNVILTLREKYDLHMKVDRFTSDEIPQEDQGFIQK